jgi:glutathione peroxidase
MTVYDFQSQSIEGKNVSLSEFEGKVLLIVNVASRCGFTPQYKGLEMLHRQYKSQGFSVLGFPCNQFGSQEPGSSTDIKNFCESSYEVTFPLFSKIDVNGNNAHPLYKFLESEKRGFLGTKRIKWNFTKFLVNRKGEPIKRYPPQAKPESISQDIEQLLKG